MSIRTLLCSTACALVLAAALPVAAPAQGVPAQGAASAPAGEAELQAAITKSNAYTALMNRTLRAIQSWERYASWVDMKKGPTGKERYISYGLYSLYDVTGEIRKAEEAAAREPKLPEIDAAMLAYIKAYQELAPLITRAERYYNRKDYRDDNLAEGKALHEQMVPAAKAFLEQRARVDAMMRVYKTALDAQELAAIEQREGKSVRWVVRNVMINARAVIDLMPTNEKPIVDLKAFDAAVAGYARAIREMDDFKDKNPGKSLFMDSQASSWLGKLRDFSEKLAKSKGDVRRGAANDANWIVNNYNTMITLSETAVSFPR
ncbi:YiiG family protein [Bosea minatitlanensis]|uniref:YiiG family protein n=1 Tax=Bosea minatitlanensis TaxID=128782 RepID=A0ABW0EZV3_9HYPH|nr:YiiG family protein [Bosea minatitlanensis]MCT4492181.1 YiiG family protein [Bosea minatitlanensis]